MTIIAQVLKRVKEADFVRYFEGKFWDKNNQEIQVATESIPGGGDNTGDAINAADPKATPVDADKLGITDSESGGLLKYLSWAALKTAIVNFLLTLDFVRVNASKDLLSGSNVVVTQAATGMRYGHLAAIAATDPTPGLFKFSVLMTSSVPAEGTTVILMMDYLDKNNTDMSSFMNAWDPGGTVAIRSAVTTDTSFATMSLVSMADQNPETYMAATCSFIGGSPFTGGESCVIQYYPPTNLATAIDGAASKATPVDNDKLGLVDSEASNVLKYLSWANVKAAMNTAFMALGYARVDSNGNLLDGAGVAVDGVNTVYSLVSAPVSGVSPLPDASDVTNGTVVAIHPDCLVGAGANLSGLLLRSHLALNQWRPPCDITKLFSKSGTLAAPIFTMTNTTQASSNKFNVGVDPVIPGGLFYPTSKLKLRMHFRRNVTAAALGNITIRAYLGTSATATSNSIVWQADIADSDNRDMTPEAVITLTSLTAIESTRNLSPGGPGLSDAAIALSTNINFAVDQKLTFHIVQTGTGNFNTLDANNTIDLISFAVLMEGQ